MEPQFKDVFENLSKDEQQRYKDNVLKKREEKDRLKKEEMDLKLKELYSEQKGIDGPKKITGILSNDHP